MPAKKDSSKQFDFVPNPEKTLHKSTIGNYKRALNRITEMSIFEHERDATKPIIKTKKDLLDHPETVLAIIKEHTQKRADKCASMAGIFYSIGRQQSDHPYVTEFRKTYYTKEALEQKEYDSAVNAAMDDTDPHLVKAAKEIMDGQMTLVEKTKAIYALFQMRQ